MITSESAAALRSRYDSHALDLPSLIAAIVPPVTAAQNPDVGHLPRSPWATPFPRPRHARRPRYLAGARTSPIHRETRRPPFGKVAAGSSASPVRWTRAGLGPSSATRQPRNRDRSVPPRAVHAPTAPPTRSP